jgi:hypothetical protein
MHHVLKAQAIQILIDKGYSEDKIIVDRKEIFIDYFGKKKKFRVDVYAYNGHEYAIECGNFPSWKRPLYERYFGQDFVKHLPYPPGYGKRYFLDFEKELLKKEDAKNFLIRTYNRYIFSEFKNDPVFDFQEFTEANRETFQLDGHRKITEINPDYTEKKEAIGRDVWMNFPDSHTISKAEYEKKIHWGMIYLYKNWVAITVLFTNKQSCKDFLSLSDEMQHRIFASLKKLPTNFIIRDGKSYWDKSPKPPLNREWNDPIPCSELTWEEYEEILGNLDVLQDAPREWKIGPSLELVRVKCQDSEITEVIESFKEIYSLLLRPETKIDKIVEKIKEIPDWEWAISEASQRKWLHELYVKRFGNVEKIDFMKACSKLRTDADYTGMIQN